MRKFAVLAVLVATTCCVGPPTRAPQPAPRPAPAPLPPPPPPVAVGPDWRDWPLNPGDWSYRREGASSTASFGVAGRLPDLVLRCDAGRGTVAMARAIGQGVTPGGMTVTSTEAVMTYPTIATGAAAEAQITARDTILDAMSFSRGRFMITMQGAPRLIVPAWPEVARVIEDCR